MGAVSEPNSNIVGNKVKEAKSSVITSAIRPIVTIKVLVWFKRCLILNSKAYDWEKFTYITADLKLSLYNGIYFFYTYSNGL